MIGIGNVGGRLTAMCRAAFNMRVLAYDPLLTAEQIKARGAEKVELDELLAQADFVSVHCPLTKQSRKMMGAAQFARMKPEAYFISTARGFIHDEKPSRMPYAQANLRCRPGRLGRQSRRRTIIR